MDKFEYSYPTRVHFGEGVADEALGKEIARMGSVAMLAYGGGSIKRSGLYNQILQKLKAAGKAVVDFGGIMSNPTYEKAQEGASLARKHQVTDILAVGGGSVVDCCKVVAVQAKLDEDIWQLEYGKGVFPTEGLALGAVVTASGTGAEMNAGAVITNNDLQLKAPLFGVAPAYAVLDPALTVGVPRIQVLSGAFDTLSHAMETYLGTSDECNPSDDVALAIMKNTVTNMRRLLSNIDDMQARGNLMWDSAMAENGILKLGRATDFQAHQIEHQLGAFTDCNHGQGLAVIHPAYYSRVAAKAPSKLARMGREVFSVQDSNDFTAANAAVDALAAFIAECGLPRTLGELESTNPITPELLRRVADSANLIKTGPIQLTHDDIYDLLLECL